MVKTPKILLKAGNDTGAEMPPTLYLNSPFSSLHFVPMKAKTAKELVNWMIAQQVKFFGASFDLPFNVQVRNMKLLLKKYSLEQVQRGLAAAVNVADHPFSTRFIEEQIMRIDEAKGVFSSHTESE